MKALLRLMILVPAAGLLLGCAERYRLEGLRVQSELYRLRAQEGATPVMVYAGDDWTAGLAEPVGWASLEQTTGGEGLGEVLFRYEANPGLARKVDIVFRSSGREARVTMVQAAGLSPDLRLVPAEVDAAGFAGTLSVAVSSNLGSDVPMSVRAEYPDEARTGWIHGLSLSDGTLSFSLDRYDGGTSVRTAWIYVTVADASAQYEARLVVNQSHEAWFQISPVPVEAGGGTVEAEVSTNMGLVLDALYASAAWDFGTQAPWAELVTGTATTATLSFAPNTTYAERTCTLTLSYTDEGGRTYTFPQTFTQSAAPKPGEGATNETIDDDGTNTYNNWTY